MTTYPAGTVAVATVRGVENVRVMAGYGTAEPKLRWLTTDARLVGANDGWYFGYEAADIRPLVVLDLPGWNLPEMVQRIRDWDDAEAGWSVVADQIEAQLPKPKPAEPTGLGAVVLDGSGRRWVRRSTVPGDFPWDLASEREASGFGWSQIDAVRVLSEGVTA